MLHVWLFGNPRFRYDGVTSSFKAPPRAISLFAYLLLGGEQTRSALANVFWRDLPEDQAGKKLRSHLWYIRGSGLPERVADWLVADRHTVRWHPLEPVWVDVTDYRPLAADPRTAEAAAELYGRGLLADIDDDWLRPLRADLRERQIGLLCTMAERARHDGDAAAAAGYARRALDIDPHREGALRILVGAVADGGNRAAALEIYRDFATRLQADLGLEPSAESVAAYEAALHDAIPSGRPKHNLPAPVTTFHGRERDVEKLKADLATRRVVSVIGTPGIGKTRLALETARGMVHRYPDGVWFIDLAPLAEADSIWATVATALGLGYSTESAVLAALRDACTLLILDNCEHVTRSAESVAATIVARCESVSLLATSREALRTDGERVVRLAPLESPGLGVATTPTHAELERYSSVQLFMDRASDALGAPMPLDHASSRGALVRILARLDGIPLAIELVAAQMDSFGVETLADELDGRFLLAATRSRNGPERQRTLHGTLDWSYALLDERERRTFRSLGIFVGTWSLKSAKAVLADADAGDQSTATAVAMLVRKSLVVVAERTGDVRYRLLEPMRSYAIERLRESGGYDGIARRHADHFAMLADDGEENSPHRKDLQPDLDNFRAALRWSITERHDAVLGARLVGSLLWLFTVDALLAEGVRWCEAAIGRLGPNAEPTQVAPVLLTLAGVRFLMTGAPGAAEAAVSDATDAVELLRGVNDPKMSARALCTLGYALNLLGRQAGVLVAATEALKLARRCGDARRAAQALHLIADNTDPSEVARRRELITEALLGYQAAGHETGEASALGTLSELEYDCGNFAEARRYAMEAYAKLRATGRHPLLAIGFYSLALGDTAAARAASRESLESSAKIGALQHLSAAVQCLSGVALSEGNPAQAARLLGASEAMIAASGCPRYSVQESEFGRELARLRERLAPAELEARRNEGRAWSVGHALGEALSV
jgi:predicted ATPase/DNA-binding SARP family transcriptional activator